MSTMPNAYPLEFRRDVVQVAKNREPGVSLEKIVADFGIHLITFSTWLKKADIDDGVKPGSRQQSQLNCVKRINAFACWNRKQKC